MAGRHSTFNIPGSMRYGLTRPFSVQQHFVEITPEEYAEAKSVKAHLVDASGIEVNFDMLLGNFEEFELELFRGTFHRALYGPPDSLTSMEAFQLYNRRLVNLLTTCKQYLDQVCHHLSSIYGKKSDVVRAFRQSTSKEYDAHFSYRLLEALRNYVQHRGLPISHLSYHSERDRAEDGSRSSLKHVLTPQVDVSALREDLEKKDTKAAFRVELEGIVENQDLKLHVREYIGGLGRVHAEVRDLIASDLKEWESVCERLQETYREATSDNVTGLAAVEESHPDVYSELIHLNPNLIKRRQLLERKNRYTKNYVQHIISAEIHQEKPRAQ
jgi:hypothetical protein